MGNDLIPARVSNPDGVFEDLHVRSINEEVLAPLLPPRRPNVDSDRHIPEQWQRWLAHFPVGIEISSSPQIKASINELTSNKPYCFKDPRFSYALPVWRSQLENCVFVCMFRNPASTASSIVRFTKEFELMHSLEISFNEALDAWTMLNRHILEILSSSYLIIYHNDLIDYKAIFRPSVVASIIRGWIFFFGAFLKRLCRYPDVPRDVH